MKKEDMSCIDCAVKNCSKMDKTPPDFCLTTHMDEEVLNEALLCKISSIYFIITNTYTTDNGFSFLFSYFLQFFSMRICQWKASVDTNVYKRRMKK